MGWIAVIALCLFILAAGCVAAVWITTVGDSERERIRASAELDLAKLKRLDEEAKAAVLAEVEKLRAEHEALKLKVAGLRTEKAFSR